MDRLNRLSEHFIKVGGNMQIFLRGISVIFYDAARQFQFVSEFNVVEQDLPKWFYISVGVYDEEPLWWEVLRCFRQCFNA